MNNSESKPILMGFSALTGLSALFFLCGFCAVSLDSSTIENVAWYTYDASGTTVYLGLSGYSYLANVYAYGGTGCNTDECNVCKSNGGAAGFFTFICFVAAIVATIGNIQRASDSSINVRNYNLITHGVISLCAIIAFGSFKNCPDALLNDSYQVGPGLSLPLVAFFMCGINFMYHMALKNTSLPSASANLEPAPGAPPVVIVQGAPGMYAQPYPQPGYPQPGYPQPGYAQPAYPQPGYPAQQYPQAMPPGYPAGAPVAYPPQAYPQAQPVAYPAPQPVAYANPAPAPQPEYSNTLPAKV